MKADVLSVCMPGVCGMRLISERQWSYMSPEARPADVRPRRAGSYCPSHASRLKRYGDPLGKPAAPVVKISRTVKACPECGRATAVPNVRRTYPDIRASTAITFWESGHCQTHRALAETRRIDHESLLDDWAMIRDTDTQDLELAAARLGVKQKTLGKILWQHRRTGDPRASLVPFAHDMRRVAA